MSKITVVDIEPMIVECTTLGVKWTHPFIEQWTQQDIDGVEIQFGPSDTDNQVYEITYTNHDDVELNVCFKSRYMDQTVTRYFKNEYKNGTRNGTRKLFEKPYVNVQTVVEGAARVLSNGSWKARHPPEKLAETDEDLCQWLQTAQIKRFHGTTKGDKIATFFGKGWSCSINIFCYIDTDGKDWWCETGD